ncbi:ABC transporter permease subunit [Herbiconiux moechotypicola]|uniref:ABC transporter permease subunit n=1 Tax=Herbiconiux moechotypicola TaxID=637393 RepID=A0ABP5R0L5_9MICO|nr:ABC transporter permease subunit [Herbiconiux moechotypicola]MCS5731794.1 ABC transporter permease subunit [Herbiconiux moechotypicola]
MTSRLRPVLYGVSGVVVLLVLAELIGQLGLLGTTWPPLSTVVAFLLDPDNHTLLGNALAATVTEALIGGAIGIAAGVFFALLAVLVPVLAPGLDRFAAVIDAVPAVALAPFLILILGREGTPVLVVALSVTFIIYISMSSGLSVASHPYQDLFTVLGARRGTRLGLVDLPAALPKFFDGLALAAPAMILGATIGEWFGAKRGLGVLFISAMQNYRIDLLWAAAALSVICSLIIYGIAVAAQRAVARRFA